MGNQLHKIGKEIPLIIEKGEVHLLSRLEQKGQSLVIRVGEHEEVQEIATKWGVILI